MSPRRELGPNGVFDRELRPNGSGSKTHDEARSPSMGPPLLLQITLMDKGIRQKIREFSFKNLHKRIEDRLLEKRFSLRGI
jgi:hypothetical protein